MFGVDGGERDDVLGAVGMAAVRWTTKDKAGAFVGNRDMVWWIRGAQSGARASALVSFDGDIAHVASGTSR